MIMQVRIKLETVDGKIPNQFWSYNLYSCLMSKLKIEYGDYLHLAGIKPINQYLITSRNSKEAEWVINLLGDEAISEFLPILDTEKSYFIEKQSCEMKVRSFEIVKNINETELAKEFLLTAPAPTKRTINLITPCSFKTNEQYAIFPTSELILKSAVLKWNSFSKEIAIEDEDAVRQLIENTRIIDYKLQSCQYHIKGIKIPSFIGYIGLSIRGPEPMKALFNLLICSLELSGMGIKCSLGMGGVKIL